MIKIIAVQNVSSIFSDLKQLWTIKKQTMNQTNETNIWNLSP